MDYNIIAKSSFEELSKGYTDIEGTMHCVWCDSVFDDELSAIKHLGERHPSYERFLALLGADSVICLSAEDKELYMALYSSSDQKQAAENCGLTHSALRVKRSRLFNEYQRNKLMLLLHDLIFKEKPIRNYVKKKPDLKINTEIPFFAIEDKKIVGYAKAKDELHLYPEYNQHYHATSIILPVVSQPDGDKLVLCCNKYGAYFDAHIKDQSKCLPESKHRWDCLGGHVEKRDLTGGEFIDEADFYNCTIRELNEELHLRNGRIDEASLEFLCEIVYSSGTDGNEWHNNEISHVYLYSIPFGTDARVREEIVDTLGRVVKSEYPIWYFSLDELKKMHRDRPYEMCDGLERVIEYMINNS